MQKLLLPRKDNFFVKVCLDWLGRLFAADNIIGQLVLKVADNYFGIECVPVDEQDPDPTVAVIKAFIADFESGEIDSIVDTVASFNESSN